MKRYNIINNSLGWFCFVVAAVTYLLTLEPTASFWDCPEFITQGFKLEVGHPPGNPIFMLTARFFVTLFGGSAQNAAIAVNSMSALLSAGTILLLFWTITHLIRRLIVKDGSETISTRKMLLIMGGGLCGALAYTWSDTFWFSAVEGEVYAFSSFCTALVFWLILKWENRADEPHSDRFLILIAYIIGISIAVHLLNLLCIPAIVLVIYYKKFKKPTLWGSLLALVVSAAIVGVILYGLVPGFIAVAQRFELFFVNTVGMSFNSGVLIYAILTVVVFCFTIHQLWKQKSAALIKLGVFASVILSGMPFIGHGWFIPFVLISSLAVYLLFLCRRVPVRIFNVTIISIFVIFIGYSSYALLLIRASADTPMNQNAPDNVFALSSYLNREQYGDRPLIYGQTIAEQLGQPQLAGYDDNGMPIVVYEADEKGYPVTTTIQGVMFDESLPIDNGSDSYTKMVKTSPSDPDRYVKEQHRPDYQYSSDIQMLFPRIYSTDPRHVASYKSWAEYVNPDFENIPAAVRQRWAQMGYIPETELLPYLNSTQIFELGTALDSNGMPQDYSLDGWKMGFGTNLRYFFNYQLNHMYWRYFMWNFAGRQNDIQGNGEPQLGNWISGIPFIDNTRLGNQELLPEEYGEGNKGHNVFYMLPLLLGLFGMLWEALARHKGGERRGIEQFWVVFFLFFMTGIAIVLYLNQPPCQPRERDYAFAGSFYAFAIWIGLGVPALAHSLGALWRLFTGSGCKTDKAGKVIAEGKPLPKGVKWGFAIFAVLVGIFVPLQMVSQTWDDHDRSGRYTARDFGMNYLNSLDDNAIIFTNGDNDTFPLWYAQEVEGERTDVKVVNLQYLNTEWYANQLRRPSYDAQPVPLYARPQDYAYDKFWMRTGSDPEDSLALAPIDASVALREMYDGSSAATKRLVAKYPNRYADVDFVLATPNMYVPLDSVATLNTFGRLPQTYDPAVGYYMPLSISNLGSSVSLSKMLSFDMIANSAAGGWKRPVYFANTVQNDLYLGMDGRMFSTGMAKMVTPFDGEGGALMAGKAYSNIIGRFRWGGLDAGKDIYLDQTVHRMISSTRLAILDVADDLLLEPETPATQWARDYAAKHKLAVPVNYADMARYLISFMDSKMPASVAPYESYVDLQRAETLCRLWSITGNEGDYNNAVAAVDGVIDRYAAILRYANSLEPGWRSRLGRDDEQALDFLTIAVGLRNYLDLRKAMMLGGATAEELSDVDYTATGGTGQYVYRWLYLDDLSDEVLTKSLDGAYSQLAAAAMILREYHDTYLGRKPMDLTGQLARKFGITVDEWRKTVR